MSSPSAPMDVPGLIRDVAARHGVRANAIVGPRRWRSLVAARQEIASALFAANWSYPDIGRALGGRHHTSVMYYLGAIKTKPSRPRVSPVRTGNA